MVSKTCNDLPLNKSSLYTLDYQIQILFMPNTNSHQGDSTGTLAHELLHVLGMQHEQERPDRDQHIEIHWDKINGGRNNAQFYRF